METLVERVTRHEGSRLKPYRDTEGKLSIGVGRNLEDNGIRPDEEALMLANDLADAEEELAVAVPWATGLSQVRYEVLIEMVFNLGLPKFLGFKEMLGAAMRGDFEGAATQMLASDWAKEVGERADELAAIMRTGTAQQ